MLKLVHDATATAVDDPEALTIDLDDLCRVAAQEMLAVALLAERRAYLEANAGELDATGKRLVVGNGYARPREVTTGAGMVEVKAPRVDDRREGERFTSAILPAYMRKSPKVTEVLPILYLRGLSTGDAPLRWPSSSARPPACRLQRSTGSPRRGRSSTRSGPPGTSPASTTSTSGPTACTSTSAWKKTACAAWSSWVCGPMARRNWWHWPTATGSPPTAGLRCCGG